MKIMIKLGALALLSLSSVGLNTEQTFYLTGVRLNEDQDNVYITGQYTCTKYTSGSAIFAFERKLGDGYRTTASLWRLNECYPTTNQTFAKTSSAISKSMLQKENYFVVIMCPPGDQAKDEKRIYYYPFGEKEVTFKESDNNIGITSGYKKEFLNTYDKTMNFNHEDRITFANFEDEITGLVYNYIDLSRFKFKYSNGLKEKKINATCRFDFYDKYNNFPYFPLLDGTMYRYLYLDVVENGDGYYTFKSRDNLYYSPVTHESSLTEMAGWRKTDNLYLPINKFAELKRMHCRISMDVVGYTNFNASGEFDIDFNRKLYGDCSDSEYCTHINEDDSLNVLEKEVVVEL